MRKKINVIIPLGGIGQRFSREGYQVPKPLVRVLGVPIILRVIKYLKISEDDICTIAYHKSLENYNLAGLIKNEFPRHSFKFVPLFFETQGAAETVLHALTSLPDSVKNLSTLVADGDSLFIDNVIELFRQQSGNLVFYHRNLEEVPAFSYLKLDDKMKVLDIVEKVKISDNACIGAYGFSSGNDLLAFCRKIIELKEKSKNEYYISNVLKAMLRQSVPIFAHEVDQWESLGTPFQVRIWANHEAKNLEKKRICFDLDNTLVTYPKEPGKYTSCEPIVKNIKFLNQLKKQGHHITIYTARRMRTHNGDVAKVIADIGELTKKQLSDFGINYDDLVFGKPYSHIYIDDLSVKPFGNLEKETGFYMDAPIEPRPWHSLTWSEHKVRKEGPKQETLREANWYRSLPENTKALAANLINVSENEIEIERINGVTFSQLITQDSFGTSHLDMITNALRQFHANPGEEGINIYANYAKKIEKRFCNFNWEYFSDAGKIYNLLKGWALNYEASNKGIRAFIHGDPVLTNIILTPDQNVKFIDPRGEIDGKLTATGDIFYDYGKLYQSIAGYDAILQEVPPPKNSHLMKYLEEYIAHHWGSERVYFVQMIAASLLFSLIPLHEKKLHQSFFDLTLAILNRSRLLSDELKSA